MFEEFIGTKPVEERHRIDVASLEKYLGFRISLVEQFKGGQSNPTYRITAADGGRYVLRRKPPGRLLPSAHAVDREYRVISALHPVGFPVARPVALCEDESVIGTAFYVMDYVEGRVLWDQSLPGMTRAERGAIWDALNQVIAKLHLIDYRAVGLQEFGKPGSYIERQIARWSKQYRASETEPMPAMDSLIEWLPKNIPPETGTAVVHGDFRLDNVIFHPAEPRVLAVLDWELSTLGDPLADFTYHLMQWHMPPDEHGAGTGTLVGFNLELLGIPTVTDYVDLYRQRTGLDPRPYLNVYLAYNFFRIAAILQGIAGRVRDGTATSEHAPAKAQMVRPLAEAAWTFAQEAGA
jgi:aminoglycoside phosphotransferase (APT) family kinase protein